MSDITIGVVADMRRQREAWQLSNTVGAQVLSFDEGTLGPTNNHIKVWTKVLQHGGDWAVVLEDDAVPCVDFLGQLRQALAKPPADVVGLYLGRNYPRAWQRFVKQAHAKPGDPHYIVSTHLLHGVGTAIRMHLVSDMLRFLGNMTVTEKGWPVDEQITAWMRLRGNKIAYTKPSIVDHADGESLIGKHPDGDGKSGMRELPRVAYEFGSRDVWVGDHWTEMP